MLISFTSGALGWPAAMIVWGPGYTLTLHRHHCVHLLMECTAHCASVAARDSAGCAVAPPSCRLTRRMKWMPAMPQCSLPSSSLKARWVQRCRIERATAPVAAHELAHWRRAIVPGPTLSKPRVEAWARDKPRCERRLPKIHPWVNRVALSARAVRVR